MVSYIESPIDRIVNVNFGQQAVFFDGHACLFNLPVAQNSSSFLGSVWLRTQDMGLEFQHSYTGKLWGSPNDQQGPIIDPDPNKLTGEFVFSPTLMAISSASTQSSEEFDSIFANGWLANFNPTTLMEGKKWIHLMVAINNNVQLSVTVDDTVLIDKQTQTLTPAPGGGLDTLPFHKYTNVPPSCWTICGTDRDVSDIPTSGSEGLKLGLAALYLAPGQYLDITKQEVRNAFHKRNETTGQFSPIPLGITASDPTGIPPLIYCDGDKSGFIINRATNVALSVFGTLQSIAGP